LLDADEQLAVAKGLREGRGEAWTALFDAYAQDAWRYASHLAGGDREATCEVVQESFLAAARAARSFDPTRGSLKAWLLGIVHLQTVQHFRRRRRELANGQALSGDRRAMLDSGAPSPAAEALQRETAEQVRRVLAEMPSDYAWLLAAKYIDERPIAALADELSAGPEAVRSKLARARRLFRSAMTHQRVKR
jgi:RNA polymerase sigma-70 factor (ECF subfamily)